MMTQTRLPKSQKFPQFVRTEDSFDAKNPIFHKGSRGMIKKNHKTFTKWIDPRRVSGIGSARRHDGGRPRDRQSIAVRTTRLAF